MITNDVTPLVLCRASRCRSGGNGGTATLMVALATMLATPLAAQDGGGAAPVVPAVAGQETVARSLVLGRVIALHLDRTPIRAALDTIAARGRLRLNYSPRRLPADKVVTIATDRITIRDAFAAVLDGTGLDVFIEETGRVVLAPVEPGAASPTARAGHGRMRQAAGNVAGRVTDAATHAPLDQVAVRIEGPGLGAVTASDGRYAIRNIPPGTYRVTARRVGYTPFAQTVTVAQDSTAAADFALAAAPTRLNEIVTTGAGQQRRVELGNAIATINADSVARQAPVTDITDLISGRAANVQILATAGIVGDGPAIRIRGRSSITGSNDPIVFVDGVRVDARPGGVSDVFYNLGASPTPSRLNDLNPNEIESIEVLRGPSAATEYGTDAANGVLVIKTKHGEVGPPRWDVGTEQGITTMPATFPLQYHSWGHTTGATPTPVACPVVSSYGGPGRDAGTCVLDSITTWQPLDHPATSIFGTGGRHAYNLQFSAGTPRVRYFAAGSVTDELGVLRMPPAEQQRKQRELGSAIPGDARYPNAEHQASLRGQATATLGSNAEASASTAYLATTQRAPDIYNLLVGALVGPGYRDSLSGYGPVGYPPGDLLLHHDLESTSRITSSLSATWHPATWLSLRGTAGLDDARRSNLVLLLPNQDESFTGFFLPGGYRSTGTYGTGVYTADVGTVVTLPLASWLGSKTAVGVQYYDTRNRGTSIAVTNIGTGNPTLNGGTVYFNDILERADEALTLGTYVDQTLSMADRLYLTGALRLDAGSGFGKSYNSALYPKASLSWVISQEPHNLLRLRAAYGQSGVQPQPGAALRLYTPSPGYVNGTVLAGDTVSAFGNPRLRPERSSEIESGADIGLFANRLTLELTGYIKTTTDALVNVPIEASLGGGGLQENLGKIRNRGVEAAVTAHPVDVRAIGWDVTLSGSVNDNKVVTLGSGVLPIDQSSRYNNPYRQIPGYPLYGFWAQPLTYRDLNHDGIIEPNEFTLGDSVTFQGSSIPIRELSLNTGVSLLNHRVRVSTQIDHRGGQKLVNTAAWFNDWSTSARDLNSPQGVPLAMQARAVEAAINSALFRINSGYVENATFTRWRELSVAYFVPDHLAAAVHARTASITLAARNLALWTHYTGADPEVNSGSSLSYVTLAGRLTTGLNHDVVADYGAVPQTRYWTLKVALGL